MANTIRDYIIGLVNRDIGWAKDNLYRANLQFRNYSPQKMNEPYGENTETPQQILDGYNDWKECAEAALEAVKNAHL